MDFYMAEDGDIQRGSNGDIALCNTPWRDDVQQAFLRLMTEEGDFLLYPTLGATLSALYGLPQTPATGQTGVNLIQSALDREGRFRGQRVDIKAVPTGKQSIRFDVFITSGSQEQIKLSIEQDLGIH